MACTSIGSAPSSQKPVCGMPFGIGERSWHTFAQSLQKLEAFFELYCAIASSLEAAFVSNEIEEINLTDLLLKQLISFNSFFWKIFSTKKWRPFLPSYSPCRDVGSDVTFYAREGRVRRCHWRLHWLLVCGVIMVTCIMCTLAIRNRQLTSVNESSCLVGICFLEMKPH